jgi:hypothetical protein
MPKHPAISAYCIIQYPASYGRAIPSIEKQTIFSLHPYKRYSSNRVSTFFRKNLHKYWLTLVQNLIAQQSSGIRKGIRH